MAINNGVGRIGIRSYVAVSTQQITTSTLLNSLYSVWNADTLGTSLDSSIFGAWNAEASNNITVKNAWNANGNVNDSKGTANGTIAAPSGTTFVTGTMSFGSGKLGSGAFTFNGSNFISLPADTLSFTGDFSVSMWLYIPSSVSSASYIALLSSFDNKTGYTTVRGWRLFYSNDKIHFRLGETYSTNPNSTEANMTLRNQWVHIVATRKSSSLTTIYINGVQAIQSNNSINPIYNSNNLAYIGASFYGFSQPYYSNLAPNGVKIDSIQTWETILDQTAVTELYNGGTGQQYPFTVSNALIPSFSDVLGNYIGTPPSGSIPVFTTGKIGNAFSFDGVNDYIPFPTNSWNSLIGTDLTISLWVKFASTANQTLISNMSYTGAWNGWEIRLVSGQPIYYVYNNSINQAGVVGSTITTNTWYHIVATRKRGVISKIYINGSLVATDSNTGEPIVSGTFYPNIGHLQYSSTFHGLYTTNGTLIDSVNLWSKEISADEVTQLYNLGAGVQYPYSSQTLPSTKNQFAIDNGTLMNGCTFTDGKIGKAFSFDGVNDYVKFSNNSLNYTNSNSFSVSMWVYASRTNVYQCLIASYTFTGQGYGWFVRLAPGSDPSNNCYIEFGTDNQPGTGNPIFLRSTTLLNKNAWNLITVSRNGSTGAERLYVNGILSGSRTLTPNYLFNSSITFYPTLGANQWSSTNIDSYFQGMLDSVNVWNRELTQAEVTELYNSGAGKQLTIDTPIVTNGLVLNLDASRKSSYPNTGAIWYDISGNGKNGTLTNGPIFGTANDGSISFDGINDCVDFGDVLDMGTKSYTINMWIKLNSTSTIYQTFLSKALAGQQNYRFAVGINNYNKLYAFLQGNTPGADVTPNGTISLPLNTWFMATFVFDRSSSISLYYNGANDALASSGVISQWNGLDFQSNNPFRVGSYTGADNSTPISMTSGLIGTTQVYDRVLSQAEITQNFNATKSRFGL